MRTLQLTATTAAVALLCSAAQGQTLRDAQRLNTTGLNLNGDNRIDGATIASGGGVFIAAWVDQFGTTEFTQDVYISRSTDDGATWSAPVRVDVGDAPNASDSELPKVAISDDGQEVVVIWEDKRDANAQNSNNEDVFANYSTDGGVTWAPAAFPLNIASAGANVDSDVDRLFLAVDDDDTFHVTWEEDLINGLGQAEDVYYTRSTDGGMTWSNPVIVDEAPGGNDVDDPKVAAYGGNVIVTWAASAGNGGDDLWIARSTDGGATFQPATTVDTDADGDVDGPYIAMRGDTVAIAVTETDPSTPGNNIVTCTVSTDGGATWTVEEELALAVQPVAGANVFEIDLAILGEGEVFVVHADDSTSLAGGGPSSTAGNRIYVSRTLDGGATWTKDVELAGGLNANRPVVTAGDDAVTIYFEFNPNGSNTGAFIASFDKGGNWSAPIDVVSSGPDVDEGSPTHEGAYLVASRNTEDVNVVFMDRPTGSNEIYVAGLDYDLGIGIPYCDVNVNSAGLEAELEALGSLSAANDNVTLVASDLPPNQFGFMLASLQDAFVPNPGGTSEGNLCLGGSIGRLVRPNQILNSGQAGTYSLALPLDQIPQGLGQVAIQAGETWYFQSWFRDVTPQGFPTSNFTNGVQLNFQ